MDSKEKKKPEAPKRVLDAKVLRKMQGLIGFAPDSVAHWTPGPFMEIDGLPSEMWPVIYIRPFDAETAKLFRELAIAGQLTEEVIREKILCRCISGWSNFWDYGALTRGEMVALPFSQDVVKDPVAFPDPIVSLAITKARELTWGLTEEEKEGFASRQPYTSELSNNPARSADVTQA